MNAARARSSGLRDTHYANPIGLDEPGNYSSAARPRRSSRCSLRAQRVLRARSMDRPRATLHSGARARDVRQPQHAGRAPCRASTASRRATRCSAGYVLVGSATRDGVDARQRRCSATRARARATPTRCALLRYGLGALPPRSPRCRRRAASVLGRAGDGHVKHGDDGDVVRVVAGAHGARRRRGAASAAVATPSALPDELEGPLPARRARRHARGARCAAASSTASRSSPRARSRAPRGGPATGGSRAAPVTSCC